MLSPNLKLTPPRRRPNILRRVRLLDTLHNNIHRKVSFVCAPAGYGKTTLLVDFAEDIDAVVYWNRISSDENNLAAFYENVVQAFQIHHPELEKASSLLFDKGTPSPQDLAYRLVNQLEETLQDFSIFILDDYHLVSEEPEIVDFIESFISYLPDHLRLLIGSRNVYGIPTALLYVQEQLAIISEDDLKFTKDEIEQLCWKYYHIQLSDKQSQMIMEQAEGWIVAILLALRSENLTVAIPKILGAREHVYTYLAEEVIKTLPAELINFLYATSLVDEFTAPMANHLLGIENAGEVIKHLDELNLFLTAASDSQTETRYRYHQLFAEFLQENLKAVQPQDVPDLHYRIASWYEEQGLHIKAVSHYFQAGEKRRAVCLIDQISREIYLSGQSHLLEQWYQRISSSEELVSQAPELLLNLAKFKANQGEYRQCELLLGYAEKPLIEREDYPNYANLLVSLGMSYRFLGRHEEAHDMALRVQAEVEKHNLDRYYWIQAERLKGVNAYYLGKPGKALESLKVAASALREMIEPTFLPRQAHELFGTLMDIGYVALAGGDIFDAHISYREALDLAKRIQSNSTVIALAYNNYGYLKYLMGDYPQAWKYYLQGLEVAEHSNNEWIMTNLYNGRGDILRELGDWKQAEAAYTKALQLSEKLEKNRSMASAYSGLGEVEILKKDFNQAMYYLREKARIQKKDINEPEFLFNFAQVYLAMGQTNLAAETFEAVIDAQEDEDQSKSAPESVVLHFDYARSLISLGQINKAKEHLRSSLELTARLGYDQFLVNAIRKNYKTVEKALKTMNSPQADSLLERARKPLPSLDDLVLDEQEDETEEAVVLSVFGLNHGEVRVNGSVLSSRSWNSVGARALFYFILDRKRVTKDEIALEFWPDFSQAKVNSNFHATLWRVRKALGSKTIIQFEDGAYCISSKAQIYFDVDEIEGLFKQMETTESAVERRTASKRVVELYQTDFIEDIDMPWADERRHALQNRFRSILAELAEEYYQQDNLAAALEFYERLIIFDSFQDHYHLRIMQCLVGKGDVRSARNHYQRYAALLDEEMGLTPDESLRRFITELD